MSVAQDVRALIDEAGTDLGVEGVEGLLLRIADTIGAPPRAITGPGPDLIWQLGERGFTVSVSSFRGKLSLWPDEFDWQQADDENYRAFEYAMSIGELPYLWSLPVAKERGVTGLAESMSPYDMVELSRSSELAFRVTFEGPLPPREQLYWRGLTLEHFDGRRWSRRGPGR